jgi:hypothetical protein
MEKKVNELRYLYSTPNIIRRVKCKKLHLARQFAGWGRRGRKKAFGCGVKLLENDNLEDQEQDGKLGLV